MPMQTSDQTAFIYLIVNHNYIRQIYVKNLIHMLNSNRPLLQSVVNLNDYQDQTNDHLMDQLYLMSEQIINANQTFVENCTKNMPQWIQQWIKTQSLEINHNRTVQTMVTIIVASQHPKLVKPYQTNPNLWETYLKQTPMLMSTDRPQLALAQYFGMGVETQALFKTILKEAQKLNGHLPQQAPHH